MKSSIVYSLKPALSMSWFKTLFVPFALLLALGSSFAMAQEADTSAADEAPIVEVNQAATLDELLEMVRERRLVESREHVAREQEFVANRDQQQQLLSDALAEKRREEQRSERLNAKFDENEVRIGTLQETLDQRLGALRELFGVLQQVAGDTRGLFEGSIISAEFEENRGDGSVNSRRRWEHRLSLQPSKKWKPFGLSCSER